MTILRMIATAALLLLLASAPPDAAAQVRLFEPGLVSTTENDELTPTFSPDGRHMVFVRRPPGGTFTLYESFRYEGEWSVPRVVQFSGTANDQAPSFSPDGRWLVFQSRRGTAPSMPRDDDLWRVSLDDASWGVPEPVPPPIRRAPSTESGIPFEGREMAPSVASDGSLFYWSALPGRTLGESDLYLARPAGESYGEPENLGAPVNSAYYETHPWIAPDGSYLLFSCDVCPDAMGASDIYVSRWTGRSWTAPVNLGSGVNSDRYDFGASVSPDGAHLYLSSNRPVPDQSGEPVQNIWRIRVEDVPALSFLETPAGSSSVCPD